MFAASFGAEYPHYATDEAERHFKTHVDTLIRKYKAQQLIGDSPEAKEAAKKKNRKNSRKSSVSPLSSDRR